jgi:hypothetical protein
MLGNSSIKNLFVYFIKKIKNKIDKRQIGRGGKSPTRWGTVQPK